MLLYCNVFIVVLISKIDGISTKKLHLEDIVDLLFVNSSRLLFYYHPQSFSKVEEVLKKSSKTFYVLSSFNDKLPQDLEGYVLDFSDTNAPINLLRRIKPHTRAMVIYNETQATSIENFMLELSYKAVYAVAIDIKSSDKINLTFNDGRTVLINQEQQIDSNHFAFKPWKPTFDRQFRVSLFNCSPFVIFDYRNEPNGGIEFNFVKHLTRDFPVDYLKINGSGNPAFGRVRKSVITKDADLGVCALWMLSDGSQEMDAVANIFPHDSLCATFLVPKPSLYVGFLNPFLPLSANLWLAIFLSMVLIYFTILLLNMFFPKIGWKQINKSAAVLNVIRILSSGSVPSTSKDRNFAFLKKILLPWSITCMILTASYSAGFTSTMNVPKYTKSIRTFSDVVEQQLQLVGTPKSIHDICENSQNPLLVKLKDCFIDESKPNLHTSFGMFVKRLQGYYVMNSEELPEIQRDTYRILNECVMNFYLTLLVPRNSPFKKIFDRESILLRQHGIIQAWTRNLTISGRFNYMKKFFVSEEPTYKYKPLNVDDIKGAFLFWFCGLALCVLVFLWEVVEKAQ